LSLPLGDACQSLQGSSDIFFVSECLPQGQAHIANLATDGLQIPAVTLTDTHCITTQGNFPIF
jgi:hypothetical protein